MDFLRDRGVRNLDGIIVSNPDADHIGGFLDIFDTFPVETVSPETPRVRSPSTPSCAPPERRTQKRRSYGPGCSWTGAAFRPTRASQNTQPVEMRFHATLGEEPEVGVALV